MKALIFAAGLGTRLQPLTLTKPKALVEINGVTLLEIAIRKLQSHGFSEIVINVHAFGSQIIDFIQSNSFDAKIVISDERDLLLDTGGGLAKAMNCFSDSAPFLAYNVDIITNVNLAKFYQDHLSSKAIASVLVRERETSRYLLFDNHMNLSGWRNKATGEEIIVDENADNLKEFAFSGIHAVDPKISSYFPQNQSSYPIIPIYLSAAKNEIIKGVVDDNSSWFDVGKVSQLKEAEAYLAKIR
ncbi:MAG: nucleotidyltransferase family protein [Bacteroidota bacterium]